MRARFYSPVLIALSLLSLLLVMGFDFYVDPFTYYHRPWTPINFSKNHRYSNPGLARQFDYQSVLVGTSHVMELESSRLSEILGQRSLNLSIRGGLIREQAQLIELILRQNKAHSIVWEMNFPSFAFGDEFSDSGPEYPQYFYTPTIETPLRYLMSFDTLVQARQALINPGQVTIDNRNRQPLREFSRQRVLENWDYQMQRWNPELKQFWAHYQQGIETAPALLEKRLLPLVRQYPEVRFKLFLPPNSILFFLLHETIGANDFTKWLEFRNALARLTAPFPNVELFDFQVDWPTIEQLEHYRDLEHYDRQVLEQLMTRLSHGKMRVDSAAMRTNSDQLQARVNAYGRGFCNADPTRCSRALKTRLGLAPLPAG